MGIGSFFGEIFRSVEGDVKTGPDALSHAMELARSNLRINYIGHYEAVSDSQLAEPLPMLCADFRNPMNAPVLEPSRFDAFASFADIERSSGWDIDDLLDADFPSSSKEHASTSTRQLHSFFVPGNWSLTITSGSGEHVYHGPTIRFVGLNTSDLTPGNVRKVIFNRKEIGSNKHASWTTNRLLLAMGKKSLHVAGYPLRAWDPHTRFTDEFMAHYCNDNPTNTDECACFRDRQDLEQQYADITLPVTCYGENCGQRGYRTAEMETETCSYQICLADVEAQGQNLKNLGTTEIYCAGKFFSTDPRKAALEHSTTQPVSTVFVPTHKQKEKSTDVETWVILGIGIVAFAILFYFLLATYVLK